MSTLVKKSLEAYFSLRKEIDTLSERLSGIHHQHLNCQKGCDQCCLNLSLFPVEYHAILSEITSEQIADIDTITSNEAPCTFLIAHACSIYPSRPIICRTHGLPLLISNDEGTDFELALCELNFTNADEVEFTTENTYPEDHFVSRLNAINREFISHFTDKHYHAQQLIPLTEILKTPR